MIYMIESNSLVGLLDDESSYLNFLSSSTPSEETCSSVEIGGDYSFIKNPKKLSDDLLEAISKSYPSLRNVDVIPEKKGLVLRSYTDKECIEKNKIMTYIVLGIRLYELYAKTHTEEL